MFTPDVPRTRPPRSPRRLALTAAVVGLLGGALAVAVAPAAAAADATVAAPLPPGGSFVPVAPTRVLDTRQGGGTVNSVTVDPRGPVPRFGNVAAVLLNVTVVDARAAGFVTVGAGSGTSNGNFVAGAASATLALVPYTAGSILITPSTPADIVVDVQGYVTTPGAATSASFTPLEAARRVADTRFGAGLQPFAAGQTQRLEVRRLAGLPAAATAVIANVTVASASASTFVTGWSGDGDRPTVSSVNAGAGDIVANRALLPLDANGRVSLYNFAGRTDLVVDVVGYLSPDASGSYYTPAPATRLLDVSGATSASAQPTITTAPGGGRPLAPSEGDLAPTTAAWLTVVGDQPTAAGFVTARPGGSDPTGTSDLNLVPSRAVANAGPVRVSDTDGTVTVGASTPTRLVADLSGWFRRVTTPGAGLWRSSLLVATGVTRADTLPTGVTTAYARGVFSSDSGSGFATGYVVVPSGSTAGTVEEHYVDQSLPGAPPTTSGASRIGALSGITDLAGAGDTNAAAVYALADTGRLSAFGRNNSGELGTTPSIFTTYPLVPNAVPLPGGAGATAVFAAPAVGYAVLDDDAHTVVSWGRADTSQLGRPATSTPWIPAAVAFPTGAPTQIAGDTRVSFGVDAAGLTTWWGSALPAGTGSTPTVQATPALFLGGCLTARSLYADTDGVWELCTDGSVVQLTSQGRLFATRQVLPVSGVTALGPAAGHGTGVRALLSDGRVADVTATAARYEAGFQHVTAINGNREVQVTLVGS